ncbi:MAG: Ubiquinone biosynthesis O-methyltransferase [Elusimicrobia bacterium]|nr:Ubiquinone biosynthesis O-methyltransferase [Elusimicrobiota bacterium]
MKTQATIESVQKYWDGNLHDLPVARHPLGTELFFKDLREYRYEKLWHLPALVNFNNFSGKKVLEIGCSVGFDLVRFSKGGAEAVGIDLSPVAVQLAERYIQIEKSSARVLVMNGEKLDFPDGTFDFVFAHGVVQYTLNDRKMIGEIHRVLKKGGRALIQSYNRNSWLMFLSRVMRVDLEHVDAPVMNIYSPKEFKGMLSSFSTFELVMERFPVKSRLQKGWKAVLYNHLFVGLFNLIPRSWVKPLGWHMLAWVTK